MNWKLIIAAIAGTSTLLTSQALPLDEPLSSTTQIIYAPPGDLTAPSDASALGLLSRIARLAEVPFGFEADQANPRLTTGAPVEAHDVTARTLRDALDGFLRMDPRYEWRDVSGVFVVRSRAAWADAHGTLTLPVHDIDWQDVDTVGAFNRIARLLYPNAVHDPFDGVPPSRTRVFSVQLREGTILDLLNAVARADGQLGWSVLYGTPASAKRFALTLGHYGNGPTFGWPSLPQPG
jgi:hypothetical protein